MNKRFQKSLASGLITLLLLAFLTPMAHAAEGVIEDPVLAQKIREEIGAANSTAPLDEADLQKLQTLYLDDGGVKSLKGLELAINLQSLSLSNNGITDIGIVAGMTQLNSLYLYNNQITDLRPLSGLTRLKSLYADRNVIHDLEPLRGLGELATLVLTHNQIESLEPLSGLAKLKYLKVSDNKIDFKTEANGQALKALQDKGVEIEGSASDQRLDVSTPAKPTSAAEKPTTLNMQQAFSRATKDAIVSLEFNNQGTIITLSREYMNITHDYGKSWVAKKLPRKADYYLRSAGDMFYLTIKESRKVENYVSKDGEAWTSFTLPDSHGTNMAMSGVQMVNGKRILSVDDDFTHKSYLYTSKDGMAWEQIGDMPMSATILWNGKGYTALGGGYKFHGKPATANQFYVNPGNGESAELVIFTSPDLKTWTQQSGALKDLNYTWSTSAGPSRNYYYKLRQAVANGKIVLYDDYSNVLTSTDSAHFTMKKEVKALQTNDYRTPVYTNNNRYYVFMWEWSAPGIVNMRMLTSKDNVTWTTTRIKQALNSMYVLQMGGIFLGYNYESSGSVMLSDDGINWKKIK